MSDLLKLDTTIGATNLSYDLQGESKIWLLDDTCTGKSYFFYMMCRYCMNNGISFKLYNYLNILDIDELLLMKNKGIQAIFCDNFELYRSQEIIDVLASLNGTLVIVCPKRRIESRNGYFVKFISEFMDDKVTLKRVRR